MKLSFKQLKKEECITWLLARFPQTFKRPDLINKSQPELVSMIRKLTPFADVHSVRAFHVNMTCR